MKTPPLPTRYAPDMQASRQHASHLTSTTAQLSLILIVERDWRKGREQNGGEEVGREEVGREEGGREGREGKMEGGRERATTSQAGQLSEDLFKCLQ